MLMCRCAVMGAALLPAVVLAGPVPVEAVWTGAGGNSLWSNPLNWSTGVVPMDTPQTRYSVTLPAGALVNLVGGVSRISRLTTGLNSSLNVTGNLTVLGDALVRGDVMALGAGSHFAALGTGSFLGPEQGRLRTGDQNSQLVFGASSLTYTTGGTLVLAEASAPGARVTFPNLTSIDAGYDDGSPSLRSSLNVLISNGGGADFGALRTVRGPARGEDRFVVHVHGGELSAPSLETVDGLSSWQFGSHATLPSLRTLSGASVLLNGGAVLSTPALSSLNDSSVMVTAGSQYYAPVTSYAHAGLRLALGEGNHLFTAQGTGSRLDLPLCESIDLSQTLPGRSGHYVIHARNGGHIDLSGLRSLAGPAPGTPGLVFYLDPSGTTDLGSLETVTGNVQFQVLHEGAGAFDALRTARDATFRVGPNVTLSTPLLMDPGGSSFVLDDGAAYTSVATVYDSSRSPRGITMFVTRQDAVMDLRSLTTINAGFDDGSSMPTRQGLTASGGTMDLRGLRSLTGPVRPEDRLVLQAWGGTLRFGQLVLPAGVDLLLQRGLVDISGGLTVLPGSSVADGGHSSPADSRIRLTGDLRIQTGNQGEARLHRLGVVMAGSEEQTLEVGGRDLGAVAPPGLNPNLSIGLLQIGEPGVTSTVRLVDYFDNAQGAGPEALYLYFSQSSVPTSLTLLSDSNLILDGLLAYAKVNGSMVLLNSLIPPGEDRVRFGDGWIVLPTPGTAAGLFSISLLGQRRRRRRHESAPHRLVVRPR